jgi:ubiquinone/menaquinone biosynthesis C-methylase UbiE
MSHHHDRRFSPEKMAKLDDPERQQWQPPGPAVEALALEPGHVVADLGVGTGYFALPIATALRRLDGGGKVLGLDVEPLLLAEVVRRVAEAGLEDWFEAVTVSGEGDLPLADASVDRFVSVNVVHELDDRPRVWREMARALRPGGRVLLVDWRAEGPYDKGPPAEHRPALGEIEAELHAAGFDTDPTPLYPDLYAIVATRPR